MPFREHLGPNGLLLFPSQQVPGLAVVIVGERKDSQTYVRMKRLACEEVREGTLGRAGSKG